MRGHGVPVRDPEEQYHLLDERGAELGAIVRQYCRCRSIGRHQVVEEGCLNGIRVGMLMGDGPRESRDPIHDDKQVPVPRISLEEGLEAINTSVRQSFRRRKRVQVGGHASLSHAVARTLDEVGHECVDIHRHRFPR